MTDYKKATQLAIKELDKEKVDKIKELIKANLQKIDDKNEKIRKLQKEIKLLKQDQKDIEEGRIDSILERQEKSKLAKDTSVFVGFSQTMAPTVTDWGTAVNGTYTTYTTSGYHEYYIVK